MKGFFSTILGLIVDDWWLALGVLISVAIVYGGIHSGLNSFGAAWCLLLLMLATLALSLGMESRKASRKMR